MNTKCDKCEFDLSELKAKLTLGGQLNSIFCPVCGNLIAAQAGWPGVFYDETENSYVIWENSFHDFIAPGEKTKVIGEFELTVEGKVVSLSAICYHYVVIFQHEGKTTLPFTGIRPEFFHYLDPNAQASGQWTSAHFVFQPALKGNYTSTIRIPAIISQTKAGSQPNKYVNGTALNIWPDFRREGWRNYFVYFVSTDPNVIVKSLKVIGENGEEKSFPGPTPRGEVSFLPAFIEITITDASGIEYWSVYKVPFKDEELMHAPAGAGDDDLIPLLAVDFGTSNTCFAVKLSNDHLTEVINFRDHTKRLIKGLTVEDSINFVWFPEVQEDHDSFQLPSELSFVKETDRIGSDVIDFHPILNYTIPPFTRYRDGEEKYVLGEFKWARSLSNSPLQPYTFDLQYLYLILAIRMALAELVADPRCQRFDQLDIVFTCPLAFSTSRRNKFQQVIDRIQHNIRQQTGINLILRKIYDESHAGEAGSGQPPGTYETIYLDVGGGTTDVGFFSFEDGGEEDQDQAIYLDSMLYAGNNVWKAITRRELSDWGLIKFERTARSRHANTIFDPRDLEPFRSQMANLDKARDCVEKFLRGLIEYATRMIGARYASGSEKGVSGRELGLYLLGNGWRFVEALIGKEIEGDLGAAIADWVKRMVEARLTECRIEAPRLKVIYPIFNDVTPKSAVVIGAATLYLSKKRGRPLREPEFTLRSFLGSDLTVTTRATETLEWNTAIPFELQNRPNVISINYKINDRFKFESERVNGRRLESINLFEQLTMPDARRTIGKNSFAYYLETWHAGLL